MFEDHSDYTIRLNAEQRQILAWKLNQFNMLDYILPVEMAMLGRLSPYEVLKLIESVACTQYLRGMSARVEASYQ